MVDVPMQPISPSTHDVGLADFVTVEPVPASPVSPLPASQPGLSAAEPVTGQPVEDIPPPPPPPPPPWARHGDDDTPGTLADFDAVPASPSAGPVAGQPVAGQPVAGHPAQGPSGTPVVVVHNLSDGWAARHASSLEPSQHTFGCALQVGRLALLLLERRVVAAAHDAA
jgi:hypothetical protein